MNRSVIVLFAFFVVGCGGVTQAETRDTPSNFVGDDVTPFDDGEVGVIVADFDRTDPNAREIEDDLTNALESEDVPFVRLHDVLRDVPSVYEAQSLYNATLVVWGSSGVSGGSVYLSVNRDRRLPLVQRNQMNLSNFYLDSVTARMFANVDNTYAVDYMLGIVHLFEHNFDGSADSFTAAIEQVPEEREYVMQSYLLYFYRGVAHFYAEDYDAAIADYDDAINRAIRFAGAYFNRANTHNALGEYDEAILDFNRAISIYEEFVEAYNGRGNTYLRLEEYELAIADYTSGIELSPDYVALYYNRARAYYELGDYQQTITDSTQAIVLYRNYAEAYELRGNAFYELGDYENMLDDYRDYERITGHLEFLMVIRIVEIEASLP